MALNYNAVIFFPVKTMHNDSKKYPFSCLLNHIRRFSIPMQSEYIMRSGCP